MEAVLNEIEAAFFITFHRNPIYYRKSCVRLNVRFVEGEKGERFANETAFFCCVSNKTGIKRVVFVRREEILLFNAELIRAENDEIRKLQRLQIVLKLF